MKYVPWYGIIDNKPTLVQIMAYYLFGMWTDGDPIYWHMYASLGLNELNLN